MPKTVCFFALLVSCVFAGCASISQGYIEAAKAREWQGCHCVRVMGTTLGGSGTVNSILATGGASIESCKAVLTCQ